MQITELRIRKVEGEGKLRAYVTVTFDDCFVVHNVKIIEGKNGLFIAMPSRKTANGEYKDVAHPISPDFRNSLQAAVLYLAEDVEKGDSVFASSNMDILARLNPKIQLLESGYWNGVANLRNNNGEEIVL